MGRILNREERAALKNHHVNLIRQQMAAVETARAPFKEAQEELTTRYNAAKTDLGKGYTRAHLQGLATEVGAKTRDLAVSEAQRFEDRVDLGLPVFGEQRDMFGSAASDTERDAIAADVDGYRAGRRADDPAVPAEFSVFASQWMDGYHKGQAENGALLKKGAELSAANAADDGDDEKPEGDGDDNQVEDDGEELTEAAIDAGVGKLKGSGFMERRAAAEVTH